MVAVTDWPDKAPQRSVAAARIDGRVCIVMTYRTAEWNRHSPVLMRQMVAMADMLTASCYRRTCEPSSTLTTWFRPCPVSETRKHAHGPSVPRCMGWTPCADDDVRRVMIKVQYTVNSEAMV